MRYPLDDLWEFIHAISSEQRWSQRMTDVFLRSSLIRWSRRDDALRSSSRNHIWWITYHIPCTQIILISNVHLKFRERSERKNYSYHIVRVKCNFFFQLVFGKGREETSLASKLIFLWLVNFWMWNDTSAPKRLLISR